MKKRLLVLLLLPLIFGAGCRDPIFFQISKDVKPLEPRIKGVPTKFVVYRDFMYVAGSSLHRYGMDKGAPGWDHGEWLAPTERVIDLAATTEYLYALTGYTSTAIQRWKPGMTEWERLGGHSGSLQDIYGEIDAEGKPIAGGKVFVGTLSGTPSENGIDYSIFYVDEGAPPEAALKPLPLGGTTGQLTGAAFDGASHFISTLGRGVYSWDGANLTQLGNTANSADKNRNLVGIIRTGSVASKVFAFGRDVDILEVSSAGFTVKKGPTDYYLTGASALWRMPGDNPGPEGNILLGLKDGTNYGYQEVKFDLSTGDLILNSSGGVDMHKPGGGNSPSSVADGSLFDTTLRPHPVNSLFQVPSSVDPAMVLFAAVQGTGTTANDINSGVWSYRERDGKWQWNAEE
jgi:hypothetical protein